MKPSGGGFTMVNHRFQRKPCSGGPVPLSEVIGWAKGSLLDVNSRLRLCEPQRVSLNSAFSETIKNLKEKLLMDLAEVDNDERTLREAAGLYGTAIAKLEKKVGK